MPGGRTLGMADDVGSQDFHERVERARQRQREAAARIEQEQAAQEAADRAREAEDRERRKQEEDRRQIITAHMHAVLAALIDSDQQPDVYVLTQAGHDRLARIPRDSPSNPWSGPEMFGIPNFLRRRARKQVFEHHHAPAWALDVPAGHPAQPLYVSEYKLYITLSGEIVATHSRTEGRTISKGVFVRIADPLDMRVLLGEAMSQSILDGLAGLVARFQLTAKL